MKYTPYDDPLTANLTFHELATLTPPTIKGRPSRPAVPFSLHIPQEIDLTYEWQPGVHRLVFQGDEAGQRRFGQTLHDELTSLLGGPIMECRPDPEAGMLKLTGWRQKGFEINQMILSQADEAAQPLVQTLTIKRTA